MWGQRERRDHRDRPAKREQQDRRDRREQREPPAPRDRREHKDRKERRVRRERPVLVTLQPPRLHLRSVWARPTSPRRAAWHIRSARGCGPARMPTARITWKGW